MAGPPVFPGGLPRPVILDAKAEHLPGLFQGAAVIDPTGSRVATFA